MGLRQTPKLSHGKSKCVQVCDKNCSKKINKRNMVIVLVGFLLCLDHLIQDCIYSVISYCLYTRDKYSSCDLHLDLASMRLLTPPYLPMVSLGQWQIGSAKFKAYEMGTHINGQILYVILYIKVFSIIFTSQVPIFINHLPLKLPLNNLVGINKTS